ncbi:bacterial proteasome activator family protein [Cellulomonas soli]|uniref:bacterial proteasome activator family protein n=1 Tax=Cellulomonas soli TaxID=931535 RepID=UPI003F824EC6
MSDSDAPLDETDTAPDDGDTVAEPDGGPVTETDEDVANLVGQPAKVMRIGTMIKQLLDEVRSAPLDDAARTRLAAIHQRSLHELQEGLSPELVDELERITLPFGPDQTPSDAELRIAQAQLVGWLEGLFHGIQTALVAQQMAAQAQLSQMRRALPSGQGGRTFVIPPPHAAEGSLEEDGPTPGQYL